MIAAMLAAHGADVPTHAIRYRDPGKEPLGDPKPIGVGTVATIAIETRQIRRARERAEQRAAERST